MTQQAVGEISMPIHCRLRFCAATSAVPQPQKASRPMLFLVFSQNHDQWGTGPAGAGGRSWQGARGRANRRTRRGRPVSSARSSRAV
jgi:hypothetical protein